MTYFFGQKAAAAGLLIAGVVTPACANDLVVDALKGGHLLLDERLRYEQVEQAGIPQGAAAFTLRTRLGYETGAIEGFKLLAEFEDIRNLGGNSYNNTLNGLSRRAIVNDPQTTELNRLQISYTGLPKTTLVVGRQRIQLDNQRFVGNSGFRQNEQTFDAVSVANQTIPDVKIYYAYVGRVLKVLGPSSPNGAFDSSSHLANVAYEGFKPLKITGYAYILELRTKTQIPTINSHQTYGVRLNGASKAGDWRFGYTGEYANQTNYGDNPRRFNLDYYFIEGTLGYKQLSTTIGYEVLSGNGTTGFGTPLASLYPFNGWADEFTVTPGRGLRDFYAKGQYEFDKVPYIHKLTAQVIYHDYQADFGPGNFGHEWNAALLMPVTKHWQIEARYANYAGGSVGFADRTKGWLSVAFNY